MTPNLPDSEDYAKSYQKLPNSTTDITNGHTLGFSTRAIHVGQAPDPTTGAVIPPISLSTAFAQDGIGVHKVKHLIVILIHQ